jgi:hypothetical protein
MRWMNSQGFNALHVAQHHDPPDHPCRRQHGTVLLTGIITSIALEFVRYELASPNRSTKYLAPKPAALEG